MSNAKTIFLLVAIIIVSASPACKGDHDKGEGSKNAAEAQTAGNGPPAGNEAKEGATGQPPDDSDDANEDVVLILKVQKDVFLKSKGTDAWRRIVEGSFHPGDVLRIGADSSALVVCTNPCELTAGEYSECCIAGCKLKADLHPPENNPHPFFMRKGDLPPDQARVFADQESKIGTLGLDVTATQFLRARLYTAWKLNEATAEVDALDQQLDKPEAKQQLGEAYSAVMLKAGDLFLKMNQKDRAADRYKKAISIQPDTETGSSAREQAAAHRRLASIYVDAGKKEEATEQLDKAKQIYVREGDEKKAQSVKRKMLTLRPPEH